MESYYKSFSGNGQLGKPVSFLPVKNDQIDFEQTHTECKDKCCIVNFFVFAVIGIGIFIYAVAAGQPKKLYNPVDSKDGICGLDYNGINYKDKPYLALLNDTGYCVKECPSESKNCLCEDGELVSDPNCDTACLDFLNEAYQPFLDYCVLSENVANVGSSLARDVIMRIWVVAAALAIAFGLSFLYIILLMFFAYYIIWGCIIVLLVVLVLAGVGLIILGIVVLSSNAEGASTGGVVLIVFGIICLLLIAIFICILCCIRSRINLCITIVKEACSGIKAIPGLLCVPVVFTLIDAAIFSLFVLGVIFLMGTYNIQIENRVRVIESSGLVSFLYFVDTLIIIWVSLLCVGLAQSVIAGALASWYFAHDRVNSLPPYPVLSAFKRTFRYSFGTICFGTFIIVVITALKMLVESTRNRNGRGGGDGGGNLCCTALMCCCMCLLTLVEKFFAFINERAYILAALTGKGFVDCAKDAFFLLLRNIFFTIVLEGIKQIPVCIGSVLIFIITAFITLIMCNPLIFSSSTSNLGGYISEYWWLVFIIALLVILFVIDTVMETITYAIDTVFIYFLIDEEYTAANGRRGYYSSPDMQSGMAQTYEKGVPMGQKYDIAVPADPPYYVQHPPPSTASRKVYQSDT